MEKFILTDTRHGHFLVHPDDFYIGKNLLYYGEYCEIEWQFIRRFIKEGDVVIDVGANLGGFAVPMAKKVGIHGKVLAFEPQPIIFECLKENARQNNLSQLVPMQMGLGSKDARLETALPDYEVIGNFGAVSFHAAGCGLVTDIKRLDDIFPYNHLSFIKIDVEGMELEVLQGAYETLRRFRPVIYIENDRADKSPTLIDWFFKNHYRLWWHTAPLFNPNNFRQISHDIYGPGQTLCMNMIALPIERIELLPLIPASLISVKHVEDTLIVANRIMHSHANDVTGA